MRLVSKSALLAAAFGLSLAATGASVAQERTDLILATASTGGTYYPVGVAIATLTKVKLEPTTGIGVSAITSAGSGENIKMMRDNEAQLSILQGLYGAYAWNGSGPLEQEGKQENLRSISMLWENVEHFLIRDDLVKTGTIEDFVALKGQPVSLGARNSGTLGSNEHILAGFGVEDAAEYYNLAYMGYGPSAEALQNRQVVGISTPAGVPVSAVTTAMAATGGNAKLLSFTPEQIVKANGRFEDLWTLYNIPAGTYPNQDQVVTTIAQPNFLAVRGDLDDETVYQITKTIYENLPFLNNIHAATRAMSLERALAGLPMPLHPGAARYYEEQGIDIPARLRPPQ